MQCDRCKVEIDNSLTHCPLCGRFLTEDVKENENYPNYKYWHKRRNFVVNFLLIISFIAIISLITINLIIDGTISWGLYGILGSVAFAFTVLLPLKLKWSFAGSSVVVCIFVSLYILFLDLYNGFNGFSVNYVIPLFLLFMALYSTAIIWGRDYLSAEFIIPLLIFTIFSAGIFIYNMIVSNLLWPCLTAFAFCMTSFIAVCIFRKKRMKNALEKSFFV